MATLVLAVGVLNLALGFALAVYGVRTAEYVCRRSGLSWFSSRQRGPCPAPAEDRPAPPQEPGESAPLQASSDPPASTIWQTLESWEGETPKSTHEALLRLLTIEGRAFREQILAWDQMFRADPAARLSREAYQSAVEAWLRKLDDWIAEAGASADPGAADGLAFAEEILLNHSFQVKSVEQALAALSANSATPGQQPAVLREFARLLDAVHSLRDQTNDALAELFRDESRLATLSDAQREDRESSTLSRVGLEALFAEWLGKDEDRIRLLSAVLVDVDRAGKINERLGPRAGDEMLSALGKLLKTLVRQNRGFDRVGRCSGQSFLLFLGDTSSRNALSGAERIRQSVEATSFRVGEEVVELTASYGVAELGKNETPAEFLRRLKGLVAEAKRAGRNRTCLDEGQGSQVLELPQYKVKGRVIEIESLSPDAALVPA